MKTFRVIEEQKAVQRWTHVVEASSEEEAIEKVRDGWSDPTDYEVYSSSDLTEYGVEELE